MGSKLIKQYGFGIIGGVMIRRLEEAVYCASELKFDVMVRSKDFETPHFMRKSFPNWELDNYERVES